MVKSAVDLAAPHHRRSARRAARSRRTRLARRRSRPLFHDEAAGPRDRHQDRRRAPRRRSRARHFDPRITNSEGGSFDAYAGRPRLRQLARFRRRVPLQLLRRQRRAGRPRTANRWSATTGLIPRARFTDLESPEHVGRTAAERALRRLGAVQSGNAEGPDHLRAAHGALAPRQHLRRRPRHGDLPQRVVPGRQPRRESRSRIR